MTLVTWMSNRQLTRTFQTELLTFYSQPCLPGSTAYLSKRPTIRHSPRCMNYNLRSHISLPSSVQQTLLVLTRSIIPGLSTSLHPPQPDASLPGSVLQPRWPPLSFRNTWDWGVFIYCPSAWNTLLWVPRMAGPFFTFGLS